MQPREVDQENGAGRVHDQPSSDIPPRRARIAVITSMAIWAVLTLAYAAHLLIPHMLGDLACEYPVGSSNYGHATWQWWSPGTSCSYGAADLGEDYGIVTPHADRPSLWNGAALAIVVVWPATTLILRHRYSRRWLRLAPHPVFPDQQCHRRPVSQSTRGRRRR